MYAGTEGLNKRCRTFFSFFSPDLRLGRPRNSRPLNVHHTFGRSESLNFSRKHLLHRSPNF